MASMGAALVRSALELNSQDLEPVPSRGLDAQHCNPRLCEALPQPSPRPHGISDVRMSLRDCKTPPSSQCRCIVSSRFAGERTCATH